VILVTGGSLGAKTINRSILDNINLFAKENDVYLLWQTGKLYANEIQEQLKQLNSSRVRAFDFIDRMDLAYSAATVVISRAGAGTISELCLVGKPSILVPSPNVSEDHQTMNALALTRKNAAIMIADDNAAQLLVPEAIELINNEEQLAVLSKNIKALALPNAAMTIATKGIELCNC
jgi:UDP-N-acetylglucosamine--N-acetylmuramyl-(pentapeptide) pyrophosphoryl-undecaprenol N-acetylglucosamine transferase